MSTLIDGHGIASPLGMGKRPLRLSFPFAKAGLLLWIAVLVAVPAIITRWMRSVSLTNLYVDEKGHLIIELFCSIVALLIAAILLFGNPERKDRSTPVYGLAFLSMGALDLAHALTSTSHDLRLFVGLHTFSTLSGSLIIFAGAVIQLTTRTERTMVRSHIAFAALTLSCLLMAGYIYDTYMPRWAAVASIVEFEFSRGTHHLHRLAGALYALTAVLLFQEFHRSRKLLAFFVALILLLYAESAFLFAFSTMWSFTWWLWHGVKVVLYFTVLVSVFVGLRLALIAVARGGRELAAANADLRSTQTEVKRINKELEIRNSMAREAMASFHLNHAMAVISRAVAALVPVERCELILNLPEDEVAEFDRMIARLDSPWVIKAKAANSSCFQFRYGGHQACCDETYVGRVREGSDAGCVCLILTMGGVQIGHLRLVGIDSATYRDEIRRASSLTGEIGPIINNALLYHRWQDANKFRSALLEVSLMLKSTLDLNMVLQAVAKASTRLLDSDAALIWLPAENGAGFKSVSTCGEGREAGNPDGFASWLQQRIIADELLRGADGQYRPLSMLLGNDDGLESAPHFHDGARYDALALFPLTEDTYLVGVMALMRTQRMGYSTISLAKGGLLAEQVRIAIHNARIYKRLNEINRRLQASEESRLRAEQLTFLGQMAASIAHEVRNPLSAMANCLAVLAGNATFDRKGQAALEIMDDELNRLNKLTHDFLLFGKPGPPPCKPVLLARVLESACANLERHICQEGLDITVRCSAKACVAPVMSDPVGLETVLWNLLLNAAQAINGTGTIRAMVRQSARHFTIVVADTGPGIPREQRREIFEPFYSRRSHGAGLGLAIVKKFVTAWHGTIRIVSRPGRGAMFLIRVPLSPHRAEA